MSDGYVLGQKIDKVYAWIGTESDGREGVLALSSPTTGISVPLIGADSKQMESHRRYAKTVADVSGLPVQFVEFSVRRDLGSP